MEKTKSNETVFDKWMPRHQVKTFFGYGETKMCSFSKDHNVRCRKVGNKQFFCKEDIERLFEDDLKN